MVCFSPFSPFPLIFFYKFLLLPCFSVFPVISHKFPCLHLIYCHHEPLHFGIVPSCYIFLLPPTSFLFLGSVLQSSNLPPLVDTALYSTHLCSFCLPALHLVYRGVSLSSDFSPTLFFLFCIHLSTTCFTVFTFSFSHFDHVDSFLCFSLLHLLEILHAQNLLLQSNTDVYNPPSLPPASTLLAGPKLLRLITACAPPDINSVLGFPAFFLDSWPLKMGPICCPETSVRNYHYLLCNNTEEYSSHLLHGVNLKSHKNKTDSVEN